MDMDIDERLLVWSARFARSFIVSAAAVILYFGQSYTTMSIWHLSAALVLMSFVSGLQRYTYAIFTVLVLMIVIPPPLLASFGNWITMALR